MSRSLLVSGFWAAILLGIALLPMAGCGSGRPDTFSVTGVVTHQGKPVVDAMVMFVPKGTRPASGKTDAEGRFTLLSFQPGDGAVVGEHVVSIAKYIVDPNAKSGTPYENMIPVLPAKYASPMQSPLRAVVTKEGSNDFRFDLTD